MRRQRFANDSARELDTRAPPCNPCTRQQLTDIPQNVCVPPEILLVNGVRGSDGVTISTTPSRCRVVGGVTHERGCMTAPERRHDARKIARLSGDPLF